MTRGSRACSDARQQSGQPKTRNAGGSKAASGTATKKASMVRVRTCTAQAGFDQVVERRKVRLPKAVAPARQIELGQPGIAAEMAKELGARHLMPRR